MPRSMAVAAVGVPAAGAPTVRSAADQKHMTASTIRYAELAYTKEAAVGGAPPGSDSNTGAKLL